MAEACQRGLAGPGDGLQGGHCPAGQAGARSNDVLEVQVQRDGRGRPQGPQPGQHQVMNGSSVCACSTPGYLAALLQQRLYSTWQEHDICLK